MSFFPLEIRPKYTKSLCGRNVKSLNVKPNGTRSNHLVLRLQLSALKTQICSSAVVNMQQIKTDANRHIIPYSVCPQTAARHAVLWATRKLL